MSSKVNQTQPEVFKKFKPCSETGLTEQQETQITDNLTWAEQTERIKVDMNSNQANIWEQGETNSKECVLRTNGNRQCTQTLWGCDVVGGNWWKWWHSCLIRAFLKRRHYHTLLHGLVEYSILIGQFGHFRDWQNVAMKDQGTMCCHINPQKEVRLI